MERKVCKIEGRRELILPSQKGILRLSEQNR